MSQENLDLVVRAIQAASKRPKPDFETVNRSTTRTTFSYRLWPTPWERGSHRCGGLQDVASADWRRSELGGEPRGAVDVGPDKVLAVTLTRFKGASSGIEMEERTWCVVTVAEGQITRTDVYNDPIQALEAAGLSE